MYTLLQNYEVVDITKGEGVWGRGLYASEDVSSLPPPLISNITMRGDWNYYNPGLARRKWRWNKIKKCPNRKYEKNTAWQNYRFQ